LHLDRRLLEDLELLIQLVSERRSNGKKKKNKEK
jgi:hypothetical protein